MIEFSSFVWHKNRNLTIKFFLVTVVASFFEGTGLAMMIPLLNLIGLGGGDTSNASKVVTNIFGSLGLEVTLVSVLVSIVALVSFHAFFIRLQQIVAIQLEQKLVWKLRNEIFSKILGADWNLISAHPHGQLTGTLIKETERVGQALAFFTTAFGFFFILLIYLGWAALINWKLSLAAALGGGVLLICFRKKVWQGRKNGNEITNTGLNLNQFIQESLYAIKVIKASSIENRILEHFGTLSKKLYEIWMKAAKDAADLRALTEPVAVMILCSGIYFSVTFFGTGGATLLVLLFIFFKSLPRLTELQRAWNNFLFTLPAFTQVQRVAKTMNFDRIEVAPTPISFGKTISFANVSFRYGEANWVLKNVDLTIKAGEMIGVIGPSGAGKSTLVDILLGIQIPTIGKLLVDDVELTSKHHSFWRKKIAYVTQETVLIHDSIENNLKWFTPNATTGEIKAAAQRAQALEFIENTSDGFGTVIGDRGVKLSGGQRQRIAIARALLQNPQILILDEATSALDSVTEGLIQSEIESQKGRLTVIVIAHRVGTLAHCDRILEVSETSIKERQFSDLALGLSDSNQSVVGVHPS
jgi:ATP-binding cassette, subfamily C, bacterial